MVHSVLFDLDETLISHSQQLRLFIRAQYDHYKQIQRVPFDVWEERFVRFDQNGYVTKDIVYSRLTEVFSIQSPSAEELYVRFLETFHRHVVPLPNMREVLVYLKNLGLKIGIVTNGGHMIQMWKIEQIGLEKLVDVILTSEQEGVEKPDSEIFLRGVRKLNAASPENCWFVGDHQLNDIYGSKRVGMTSVWIKNGKTWDQKEFLPNYTIEDLIEIKDLLRENRLIQRDFLSSNI